MVKFFSGQKKVGKGYTQNVMASINWVIGFVELLFGAGVIKGPALWIQIFSAFMMVALVVFYCWLVRYFAIHDPSRLQSEGYNLEIQAMNALNKEAPPEEGNLKVPLQKPIRIQQPQAENLDS